MWFFTNVGLVKLEVLPWHIRCGRDTEGPTANENNFICLVQMNLEGLTHQIPIASMEDLLEEIQRRVVGVPHK